MLSAVMPPRLAGLAPPNIDGRVLAFAAVLALVTGVGFGLWPAWGASSADLAEGARSGGRGSTAGGAGRGRRILVGAELALAVLLLVGAGLILRSFARLVGVNSGVEAQHVATFELNFGTDAGPAAARAARVESIVQRLTASPGIAAAGVVNVLPLGGDGGISISVHPEGQPLPPPDKQRGAYYLIASGGYFNAMGIPLLEGRTFTAADDSGAPSVAVISRAMVAGLWPDENPIGRRFPFVGNSLVTVIGVVGDVHVSRLDDTPIYQMYFPFAQKGSSYLALVARGTLAAPAMLARLRDAVHTVDPAQAVYRERMMDDVVSASIAPQRTNALLIALFGALALVLTSLGVYAVVAYSVAQRRRELGIRAALGATGRDLIALVSREMLWVMALGLAVGLVGAWAASRVLSSLVFGVSTHDPATFVLAPLALIVPAALATFIPARRAARTNPVDVIREE
jgi:predicted permease